MFHFSLVKFHNWELCEYACKREISNRKYNFQYRFSFLIIQELFKNETKF
jgi:hypothetical protein